MKKISITSEIEKVEYNELTDADRELLECAKSATFNSYAPYSNFKVGAAARLLNGTIVTGCNQENSAFPSGLCAERTTIFHANAVYPDQPVTALAIAARNNKDEYTSRPIAPCGGCRQVLIESEQRYNQDIRIILYGTEGIYIIPSVHSILPISFDADFMNG